eukprot:9043692-Alexandrium_andersonii.AAC.1
MILCGAAARAHVSLLVERMCYANITLRAVPLAREIVATSMCSDRLAPVHYHTGMDTLRRVVAQQVAVAHRATWGHMHVTSRRCSACTCSIDCAEESFRSHASPYVAWLNHARA